MIFHQTPSFLNLYKINNILGKFEKYKNLCKIQKPVYKMTALHHVVVLKKWA